MDAGVPRILHVAETAQGGVGSYIEDIVALHVQRHGHASVCVVMPREHAAHFARLQGPSLCAFELGSGGRVRSMLRMARQTWTQLRCWKPDVVHVHSTYAGFMLRPLLALLPARPRVVYCAHGWAFDRDARKGVNRVVAWIERVWARWCDAIVCISRHDADSALRAGLPADRLITIANGIPDQPATALDDVRAAESRWQEGTLRVLFVGRLDRQKGVDVLFDALRRLGPRASAVIVGSAVVADETTGDLPAHVHVTGWLPRDRIAALYAGAQVLVVPSRWEGFGLVALEAMRAGCAVVASRVGGLPDVIDDGVTGALFPSGDGAALAALLARLSDDTLRNMGAAGRARFEREFEVGRVGDELEALYRRLLKPWPAPVSDDLRRSVAERTGSTS